MYTLEQVCGTNNSDQKFSLINSDRILVFTNDPNYSTVQLWNKLNKTVYVNSFEERLAELERIRLEEEEAERQRLKAIEDEKQANFAQTGYMELDTELEARELAEEQARIEKEIKRVKIIK